MNSNHGVSRAKAAIRQLGSAESPRVTEVNPEIRSGDQWPFPFVEPEKIVEASRLIRAKQPSRPE